MQFGNGFCENRFQLGPYGNRGEDRRQADPSFGRTNGANRDGQHGHQVLGPIGLIGDGLRNLAECMPLGAAAAMDAKQNRGPQWRKVLAENRWQFRRACGALPQFVDEAQANVVVRGFEHSSPQIRISIAGRLRREPIPGAAANLRIEAIEEADDGVRSVDLCSAEN